MAYVVCIKTNNISRTPAFFRGNHKQARLDITQNACYNIHTHTNRPATQTHRNTETTHRTHTRPAPEPGWGTHTARAEPGWGTLTGGHTQNGIPIHRNTHTEQACIRGIRGTSCLQTHRAGDQTTRTHTQTPHTQAASCLHTETGHALITETHTETQRQCQQNKSQVALIGLAR